MTNPLPPIPGDTISKDGVLNRAWYGWFAQLYTYLTANLQGGGGILSNKNTLTTQPPLEGGGSLGADLTIGVTPGAITPDLLAGGIPNDKLAGGITSDKLAGNIPNALLSNMAPNTVKANNTGLSAPPVDVQFVAGAYNPTFQSGFIQFAGPNGLLTATQGAEIGLDVPNPSGVNGPVLLLGSGGGNGTPVQFWIIQDQAFDNNTAGNTLGITAGETQASGTAAGGLLWLLGGGSFGGTGGEARVQGGTSLNGPGGQLSLFGGNSTNGPAGDAFLVGGQSGTTGANVHLVATKLNGVAGDVRIRINSTILVQFLQHGEIFLTQSGTGAGLPGQPLVSGGTGAAANWQTGFTGTVTTAKLTPGGTNGSMTLASGILISQVQAT